MDEKVSALTNYTTPLDADIVPVVDTANTTTKGTTWANIKATLKTYFDTLYPAETTSTLGATINGATAAVPNDTDLVATVDTSVVKKITWTNVKAFLKTYFDTLYSTKALDNLASVAINTTLASDTDNTDDLGTTLKKWANLFVTNIGATATRVTKGWFTDIESTNMPTVNGASIVAASSDINAGTSTVKFNTPDAFAGSNFGIRYYPIALNGSTALTTSDKFYFRIPAGLSGMNLVSVTGSVGTGAAGASSSGTPTFTVKNVTDNNQMLSTSLTIDANEYTSATAATAVVIDTTKDDVVTDDLIEVACTTAGTGVTYAVVTLGFQLP